MESLRNMVLSDKTHAKLTLGTFISLIVVIVGGAWAGAIAYANVKHGILNNTELIIYNRDDIKDIEVENKDRDRTVQGMQINQAQIDTKLLNIEVGIAEIKSILKDD